MAIPSRQIGWGTTDNLLWEISKQIEGIGCVIGCGTSGSGSSGTSGVTGSSGTSGASFGTSGTSGVAGTAGTSGITGTAGTSGTTGQSGTSGINGVSTSYYGSFYDVQDQYVDTVSTGLPVLCRQTDATCTNGFSLVSNSQITAANTGKYNFQFSFQLHNPGGGGSGQTVEIWLTKNGLPVADTNTRVAVNTNSPYIVAAWNFFIAMTAGDYVEIYWATDNDNIHLQHNTGSMGGPAIPSTIITVSQIG